MRQQIRCRRKICNQDRPIGRRALIQPLADRLPAHSELTSRVRLTQIPKELCDSIQVGSFIETDPLASSWELNLYGTEADKIALCQLASELVDTSQCQVAKEDDDSE